MTLSGNKWLYIVLKLACGGGLLGMLFYLVDKAALRAVLGELNVWIFLSLPVFYVHTALRVQRWRIFLQAQGVALPYTSAFRIYTSGTFLGLISPGRVGEVYRAWMLYRERGVNPGLGIAAVVVDRLVDLAILLSLGAFGFFYLVQQGLGGTASAMVAGPVWLASTRVRVASFLRRVFRRMMAHMPEPVSTELPAAYRAFVQSLTQMRPGLAAKLIGLTLLAIAVYCGHVYFIATVLGLPIGFFALSGVLCASTFVTIIPVSINAIGTRDAFLVATLPLLGVGRAEAFGFALVFLLLFVANTLMAFPFWLYGRKGHHCGTVPS